VNLVLLEPEELGIAAGECEVELRDRRAAHLISVVRVTVGSLVRVGVVQGGLGQAEVVAMSADRCRLRVLLDQPPPAQLPVHLILAVPRPKVLLRTVAIAASFGVESIHLTNSWRVDKSYLGSPALLPAALERAARDGAEQGATSRLPQITVHRRLMSLLDGYPSSERDPGRVFLVAHPGAAASIERAVVPGELRPLTVAVGPEGGWIDREVETFVDLGFVPASLGESILRVEAAIAALLAQVQLLRRLTSGLGPR
jgi:16S rRNA (uracil1498-N3)-methyltransferase